MKIVNVVGAGPNLIKITPLMAEMRGCADIQPVLVHAGQHYDDKMSKVFLDELAIPEPDHNLQVSVPDMG